MNSFYSEADSSVVSCPRTACIESYDEGSVFLQREFYLLLSANRFLQKRLEAALERIAFLERELELAVPARHETEDTITLPLNVKRRIPARIVGTIKPAFYLFGAGQEEE